MISNESPFKPYDPEEGRDNALAKLWEVINSIIDNNLSNERKRTLKDAIDDYGLEKRLLGMWNAEHEDLI